MEPKDYKNYVYQWSSKYLEGLITVHTCQICGTDTSMKYGYDWFEDEKHHICDSCKLKNERDIKINNILD